MPNSLQLMKLFMDNRTSPRRFEVKADAADAPTIYLYDMIVANDAEAEFFGGVSAERFVQTLNDITAPVINIRLNSPGGDAFAGRAMETAIRNHPSQIVAYVDGYAASAASYVALAADKVLITKGGFFMIHRAISFVYGNSLDMLDRAALLDKVDQTLADTYAEDADGDRQKFIDWMTAETWFTAQEAVDAGLADGIIDPPKKAGTSALANCWNLSAYQNAPKNIEPPTIENKEDLTHITDDLLRRVALMERIA